MDVLLAVIVFLLGAALGVLVLHYVRHSRDADRMIEASAQIAEEESKQRNAIATVQLKEVRIFAQALLRELRIAAEDRRRWMALVDDGSDSSPESGEEHTRGPDSDARPITTPGVSTLPPDAPTPQTGYSLPDILRHRQEQHS